MELEPALASRTFMSCQPGLVQSEQSLDVDRVLQCNTIETWDITGLAMDKTPASRVPPCVLPQSESYPITLITRTDHTYLTHYCNQVPRLHPSKHTR